MKQDCLKRIFKALYGDKVYGKANNYRRGKNSFYLPKKITSRIKDFRQFLQFVYHGKQPTNKNVYVVIRLFYADNRKRDIDNVLKTILDTLEEIVYTNDRQVVKLKAYKHVKQKKNAILIEVYECGM